MATEMSLDEARTAVLIALDDALHQEVVTANVAAEQAQAVRDITDLLTLDQWVFRHPVLKWRFCRYPLCFRPPRPADKPGHPPAYCVDGRDEQGLPHDNAQRSRRRRETLLKQASGHVATDVVVEGEVLPYEGRPVTAGRASFAHQVTSLSARFDQLVTEMKRLRETAERTVDEEARLAEIEAIQSEATQKIQQHNAARLAAEQRVREITDTLDEMASIVEEANRAADEASEQAQAADERAGQAQQDKDRAVVERKEMEDKLTSTIAEATQKVGEAEQKARRLIAEAERQFAEELARRTEDMQAKISHAETARQSAVAEAENVKREAAIKIEAANTAVKDAQAVRTTAQEELRKARDLNAELQNAALHREREFEQELNDLRHKHEKDMQQRLAQQREDLDKLHAAELKQMEASTRLHVLEAAQASAVATGTPKQAVPDSPTGDESPP